MVQAARIGKESGLGWIGDEASSRRYAIEMAYLAPHSPVIFVAGGARVPARQEAAVTRRA